MNELDRILSLIGQKYGTDKAFEDDIGIPNRTVNDWKRGKSKSYLKLLPKIANTFNVTVDYLLGTEQKENSLSPLSDKEQELLDLFRQMSPEQQAAYVQIMKARK